MKMKMKWMLVIGAVSVTAVAANAATVWTGVGTADVFTNTANWSAGLPTLANVGTMDDADFVWSTAAGDMNSIDLTVTGLAHWDSSENKNEHAISDSVITITGLGAKMTSPRGVNLTNTAWSVTNDAELAFGRDFILRGSATAQMNSPNVFQARSLELKSDGVFTLADGTLHLNNPADKWGLIPADSAYLDITSLSATYMRAGDFVTKTQGHITNGFIRYNGSIVPPSSFAITYDGTNTVVTLLPPGTPPSVSIDATNTVYVGDAFTLTADVVGSAPITYQWYKDGGLLPDETNTTYSSASAVLGDAGDWSITVNNAFGTASVTTEVVAVDLPALVYWDNESGDGNVDTVSNWDPDSLPSFALDIPGVVTNLGGGTTVLVAPAESSLNDMNITFEDDTSLDLNQNITMVGSSLLFKGTSVLSNNKNFDLGDGSSLVFSNTPLNLAKVMEVNANCTITAANSASVDIKRAWKVDSSSITLNWFSTGTMRTGLEGGRDDGVRLNKGSGNVINISAGKLSGDEEGFLVTSGNYINFTDGSTGILEARGIDFSSDFITLVTNGLIRTDGVVTTNSVAFDISYDGTNTTMSLMGGGSVVSDIEFSNIGYVTASNGMVLGWTTDPVDSGLDVYRTMNLVTPTWSLIATDVVGSFTDTAITNKAFYQLVPTGETYP